MALVRAMNSNWPSLLSEIKMRYLDDYASHHIQLSCQESTATAYVLTDVCEDAFKNEQSMCFRREDDSMQLFCWFFLRSIVMARGHH